MSDRSPTEPNVVPALRPWQSDALAAWCVAERRGVVEAVTGTGKTRVAVEAILDARTSGRACIVMVPSRVLVRQWVAELARHGIDATENPVSTALAAGAVVVATVQTLARRPEFRSSHGVLLVADECHRYGARSWAAALHEGYALRLGLTAHLDRDEAGLRLLNEYFGGCVFSVTTAEAIAQEYVVPYTLDLLGVSLTLPERSAYERAEKRVGRARATLIEQWGYPEKPAAFMTTAARALSAPSTPRSEVALARSYFAAFGARIELVTEASQKLTHARYLADRIRSANGTLLFTRTLTMAQRWTEALQQLGLICAIVSSEVDEQTRDERLRALQTGPVQVVVAVNVLDEGVDVPNVDLAVITGGTRSRRQMTQRLGRALRRAPGKQQAALVLVYARETIEDLTESEGEESALDVLKQDALFWNSIAGQERRVAPQSMKGICPTSKIVLTDQAVNHAMAAHAVTRADATEFLSRAAVHVLAGLEVLDLRREPLKVSRDGIELTFDTLLWPSFDPCAPCLAAYKADRGPLPEIQAAEPATLDDTPSTVVDSPKRLPTRRELLPGWFSPQHAFSKPNILARVCEVLDWSLDEQTEGRALELLEKDLRTGVLISHQGDPSGWSKGEDHLFGADCRWVFQDYSKVAEVRPRTPDDIRTQREIKRLTEGSGRRDRRNGW